jgi:murein DD-endopeptidase MepM/ murein hydrolase activator NlpD
MARRAFTVVGLTSLVLGLGLVVAVRRPAPLPVAPTIVVDKAYHTVSDTLRWGETISELFDRQGVAGLALNGFSPETDLDPRRLRAGMVFTIVRELPTDTPTEVRIRPDISRIVRYVRGDQGWDVVVDRVRWTPEVIRIEGPIDHSLYLTLDELVPDSVLDVGERTRLAWDLAEIYAWTIDFTRDIRAGDHVQVVLERDVSSEGEIRFGRVLASDLQVLGSNLPAYRFTHADNSLAYYDDEGLSLRRAFLRYPVRFRRISSRFSTSRRHPVLGITRKHPGIDYAADAGTAVMATADGVVRRAEWAGSYGRLVEIRHKNGINTRYAHLSGFASGIRAGTRVTQGQTIGYVGMTGLANGPHLHYEFREHGQPRNPLSVDYGNGDPISDVERAAFESERGRLEEHLYPVQSQSLAHVGE